LLAGVVASVPVVVRRMSSSSSAFSPNAIIQSLTDCICTFMGKRGMEWMRN
jgi:hypothetical protein